MSGSFKETGRGDVVKIDVLTVNDADLMKLTFESKNSPWRQGVWLKTDEYLLINQVQCPSAQLWQDTAPKEVLIECHTRDNRLHLYNIWDRGKGCESQSWSSGMLGEELPNGRRYRCNDIGFDTDFGKLVSVGRRSLGHAKECAFIVPSILQRPTAIFSGLRQDEDEDRKGFGWRCYCGVPEHSYRPDGSEARPYPNQVYLVFVNDERVAYNWRWEKADPNDPTLPRDHETRFRQRLL